MRYYMLNKPRGCVTACRDARHKTVMDCFPEEIRDGLFPVGRLDRDTEGLLLVTDDGMFSHRLMEPHHHVSKTYFFHAVGVLTEEKIRALESGVAIYDEEEKLTSPAKAEFLGMRTLLDVGDLAGEDPIRLRETRRGQIPVSTARITITEGKKHQVKRMIKAVGMHIVYLERVAIADLPLDPRLARGEYRALTEDEVAALLSHSEEFEK